MSDVGEPLDVSPAMVKCVDELVGDDPAHMRLIPDIILTQNNLGNTKVREVCSFLKPAALLSCMATRWKTPLSLLPHIPSSPTPGGHACSPIKNMITPPELTTPVCLRCRSTVVLRTGFGEKQTYLKHSLGPC